MLKCQVIAMPTRTSLCVGKFRHSGRLSGMRSDIVKEDYTSFSSLEVEECPIISIFSGAEQLVWSAWPGGGREGCCNITMYYGGRAGLPLGLSLSLDRIAVCLESCQPPYGELVRYLV